ncbi:MAG: azurin [Polaromonas sp.]|nr:azurin [Polaromonas sp.]
MTPTLPQGASPMNIRIPVLAAACALALVACGDKSSGNVDTATPAPAAEPALTAPSASVDTPAPVPVAAAPVSDKPAAVVADCATEIEGSDAMQYNVGSITVPASCTEFKITLKHPGQMLVAAMGHNVVIVKAADMQAVAAEGIGAGINADYVKPGDARVIAHTKLIGAGETVSVSFPVAKIQRDGPYEFFFSFPGHSTVMKGTIAVQ